MSRATTGLKRIGSQLKCKAGLGSQRIRNFPKATGLVVHALHKSASMFLCTSFSPIFPDKTDCPLYSIHNSPADENAIPADTHDSFVLCPIRNFDCESYQFPNLERVNYLIQVRDPRDILVSEYFSLGWLHSSKNWSDEGKERREKIQSMSIDDFVLDESLHGKQPLFERMEPVLRFAQQDNVELVKYETLVTQFPVWLETVMRFAGLGEAKNLTSKLIHQYKNEFQPDQSGGHKRNIVPGDYKEKLNAQTIETLNQRFSPVLKQLDYF